MYSVYAWGPQPVNEFHPDRHLTKRHPLAYMPFGARLALCKFMKKFDFHF
jgi:hypothetical protein